jgi:hypothetical protein
MEDFIVKAKAFIGANLPSWVDMAISWIPFLIFFVFLFIVNRLGLKVHRYIMQSNGKAFWAICSLPAAVLVYLPVLVVAYQREHSIKTLLITAAFGVGAYVLGLLGAGVKISSGD